MPEILIYYFFLHEQNAKDHLILTNVCLICISMVVIGAGSTEYAKILSNTNGGSW